MSVPIVSWVTEIHLYESHACFQASSGQQALPGVLIGGVRSDSIHRMNRSGFSPQIHDTGSFSLHSIRDFKSCNPRFQGGVSTDALQMLLVPTRQQIQLQAL